MSNAVRRKHAKYDFRVDNMNLFSSTRAWWFEYRAPVRELHRINELGLMWTGDETQFCIESPYDVGSLAREIKKMFGPWRWADLYIRFSEDRPKDWKSGQFTKWICLGTPLDHTSDGDPCPIVAKDKMPEWLPRRDNVPYGRKIA